jgi:hypothetical protein
MSLNVSTWVLDLVELSYKMSSQPVVPPVLWPSTQDAQLHATSSKGSSLNNAVCCFCRFLRARSEVWNRSCIG